jgi:hypothetical protein
MARMIEQLVTAGNKDYNDRVKADYDDMVKAIEGKMGIKTPLISRSIRTTQGYGRHFNVPKPNPKRKARKTLNGEIKHQVTPRGFGYPNVGITRDSVRALEKRIGKRIHVRDHKCFLRSTTCELPIDITADNARKLLKEYLRKEDTFKLKGTITGRASYVEQPKSI